MKNLTTQLAATILILSSCAQNELVESPNQATPNDGKIRFAATSALTSTRAADDNPFNNTAALQKLGKFTVDGYYNGASIYTTAQEVTWQSGSWEYGNEPYWPSGDAKINFFAHANWDNSGATVAISSTGIEATPTTPNTYFEIKEDVLGTSGQHDYLVAATLEATKQSRTLITFKHALTQLIFKAGNVDADKLDVRIGGVRIVNVKDKATKLEFNGTNPIKWTLNGDADANYHVQGLEAATDWSNPIAVDATKAFDVPTGVTLGGSYTGYNIIQKTDAGKNNALLLFPQPFNAWDPNKASEAGSYIELLAVVKDPTNASAAKLAGADSQDKVNALKAYYYSGAPVYSADGNTETYGLIRIPVSSVTGEIGEWIAGKRITYIVTFGDKGSGSGGGGYNPDGDPILVPIRFNAIVEDWVDVNVPLLTATFEATSGTVDGAFVTGYTKQLVNDIKAARIPKVYKSSIKIKGQLSQTSQNQEINVADLNINNILVGSTVTYDFTGIDQWGKTLTIGSLPANWTPTYYKGSISDATKVDTNPALDGTVANIVVLTKNSETNKTYTSAPQYITDYITAIRVNENNNTVTETWVINVAGAIAADVTFSADDLAVLGGTSGTEVEIGLTGVTFSASAALKVTVPAGWKATCGTTTKFVGETLSVTENTNSIKFIKL